MTRTLLFAIIGSMLSAVQSARAQGYYRVDLEPDTAKRRAIPIDFGSYSANLWLYSPASWQIGDSAIIAQDDTLWTGPTRSSGPHVYHMLNAYSSREYVVVYGNLVKPGGGPGYSPWFHVTVPAVDVDWNGYTAKADETDEDSREIYCPVTTNKTLWKKLLIQRPSDDTSLVPPTLTLTYPAGSLTLRKADGTAVSSGWSFNAGTVQNWPVTLYADPVAGQGNYSIILKGSSDGVNQPEDHVMGSGLTVDLDVDANYDGGISAADEALEESAGGILRANTDDDDWNGTADKDDPGPAELEDDLLPIQLALDPSDAGSGQLKLEAVSGGSKIRLWGNSDKTGQVTLPKTWTLGTDTVPGTLYAEGLAASDAMRDIALRLRYTDPADTAAYCEDNIKLTALGVDLDVDSDYDGAITEADEALEESAGGIAAVGGGLRPVNVRLSPAGLASGTLTLTLFAESQNKIRVWPSNSTNGTPLSLPKTWTVGTDTIPPTLYVQGVAASSYPRDLELVLSYANASYAVSYFSDSIRMTVVKVDIYPGEDDVTEGDDSEDFRAVVTPADLSDLTYAWSYQPIVINGGNNPSVTFSAPNAIRTHVDRAHWYAVPDARCANNQVSKYCLWCTVSVGGTTCSNSATMSVQLVDPAAETIPAFQITGYPAMAYNAGSNFWYVSGKGTLARQVFFTTNWWLHPNSEFTAKIQTHENQHCQDCINGFDSHQFVTVNELFARISLFTDATSTGLTAKIDAEWTQYYTDEQTEYDSLEAGFEVRAYDASDAVAPDYYYSNCGRFTYP